MNELLTEKGWWSQNLKWLVPLAAVFILAVGWLTFLGLGSHTTNFMQAYAEKNLVENAILKAQQNERVQETLGDLEVPGKMAILNGEVNYSEDNNSVDLTLKVNGSKGNAMMDISAERNADQWNYNKIIVRIKNPPGKKETIHVIPAGASGE